MSANLLFEHPEWWHACALGVALVAVAIFAAQRLARRRVRSLLGERAKLAPGSIRGDWALLAALVFVAIALLGPRIGERTVLVSTRGVDVVFLFDVSQSMDARDIAPSRMHRARAAVAELLERLEPEDRAALAAFAGRGVLLTPLTPDAAALREMLPAVDTRLIRPGASDLAAGVTAALTAFEAASDRPRVLFVSSDGEIADRDSTGAGTAAARANARVLVAALGSETGATIPNEGSELRDSTGQVVVTRRRIPPLAGLAEASDGRVFEADEWGEFDLAEAVREIGREARGAPGELVARRVAAPMVLPFAAVAFLLLLAEWLPASWLTSLRAALREFARSRGRVFAAARKPATVACAALLLLVPKSGPAEADEKPASDALASLEQAARTRSLDATELLQLGLERAQRDRWREAENSFLAAAMLAGDRETAAIAYHDLGVAALRRGELAEAQSFFFDSLAARPDHPETRFNLEWTIAALRVAQEPDAAPPLPKPPLAGDDDDESERPDSDPGASDLPSPSPERAEPEPRETEKTPPPRPEPPPLSEERRAQWIEGIRDDPAKALHSAAQASPGDTPVSRRRGEPNW